MATLLSKAEKSYIVTSLTSTIVALRHDGRDVHDYRTIHIVTGNGNGNGGGGGEVAPLANGSAKVSVGGTTVVAAVRLEVEDISGFQYQYRRAGGGGGGGGGSDEGRIRCNVTCSPAAYPHLSSNQQDEIQNDLTSFVHSIYSSNSSSSSSSNSKSATTTTANASSRRSFSFFEEVESELVILPGRKAWTLYLDAVVLSDAGNLYDVLFLACRGALWDTRVPRTRAVEYQQQQQRQPNRGGGRGQSGMGGGDEEEDMWKEAIRTRVQSRAADFELEDTSEAGKRLSGREKCPVAVTLNILPTRHVLDATYAEEQAVPLKLVLLYSFTSHEDGEEARFLGMRLIGPGQVPLGYLKELLRQGQGYAKQLVLAMDAQLVAQEEGSRD